MFYHAIFTDVCVGENNLIIDKTYDRLYKAYVKLYNIDLIITTFEDFVNMWYGKETRKIHLEYDNEGFLDPDYRRRYLTDLEEYFKKNKKIERFFWIDGIRKLEELPELNKGE